MARKKKPIGEGEPIVIKKYANRRLYNPQTSQYITLDFLADLTRQDVDFIVVDAKSGDDITRSVLTQIIMEEESSGKNMLPASFLKQIISLYGDSMQSMVPDFLDNAMDNFRSGRNKVEDAIENTVSKGPFGDIAKQNIKMARAARDALIAPLAAQKGEATETTTPPPNKDNTSDELAELKEQMAQIQKRIERLDK